MRVEALLLSTYFTVDDWRFSGIAQTQQEHGRAKWVVFSGRLTFCPTPKSVLKLIRKYGDNKGRLSEFYTHGVTKRERRTVSTLMPREEQK